MSVNAKLKASVTKNDIKFGVQNSPQFDPVARALVDIVPKAWGVYVCHDHVLFRFSNGYDKTVSLPGEAQRAIKTYDLTGKMQPFDFEIENPNPPKDKQ